MDVVCTTWIGAQGAGICAGKRYCKCKEKDNDEHAQEWGERRDAPEGSPAGVVLSSVSALKSDDGMATADGGAEAGISISSAREAGSACTSNEYSERSDSSSAESEGSAVNYINIAYLT
jgi:hypothetical protein